MKFHILIKKLCRYVHLIILVSLIGVIFVNSLSISNLVYTIKTNIYESLGAIATIQGDSYYGTHYSANTYYEAYDEYKTFLDRILNHDNVIFSSTNYMLEYVQLNDVIGSKKEIINTNEYNNETGFYEFYDNVYTVDLIGISTSELIDELTGHIRLTKGRYLTKEEIIDSNSCIILDGFVKSNGKEIKIGDTINVNGTITGSDNIKSDLNKRNFIEPVKELKVVGMFEVVDKKHDIPPYGYSSKIYVSYNFVENYSKEFIRSVEKFTGINDLLKDESQGYFNYFLPVTILPPYIELNSFEDIEEYKIYCENLLSKTTYIKDKYRFIATSNTAERIVEPVDSIVNIADIIKLMTIFALGFVNVLLIRSFVLNNSNEIAIYQALGKAKNRILLQYICELSIILTIAFAGIGLTAPFTNDYIIHQIKSNIKIENNDGNIPVDDYLTSGENILNPNQIDYEIIIRNIESISLSKEYIICGIYIFSISTISCYYYLSKSLKHSITRRLN